MWLADVKLAIPFVSFLVGLVLGAFLQLRTACAELARTQRELERQREAIRCEIFRIKSENEAQPWRRGSNNRA